VQLLILEVVMGNPIRITAEELNRLIGTARCPAIIDVRRKAVFDAAPNRIAGATWHDHMTISAIARDAGEFVAYCAHGHNVSEIAAANLRAAGADVRMLEGGIEAYAAAGGLLVKKGAELPGSSASPSVWVTRERPKIDRIACPWLIRRFIDPRAVFHFTAPEWVSDVAAEIGGIAYDIDGVFWSHRGETCTFDTLIAEYGLSSPALDTLATIVRGADTARLDLAPQAAGLLAISLGLSRSFDQHLEQLEAGMLVYDALYVWARDGQGETHNWPAAKPKT
jgi:rhodanese-related sulfurtransferase